MSIVIIVLIGISGSTSMYLFNRIMRKADEHDTKIADLKLEFKVACQKYESIFEGMKKEYLRMYDKVYDDAAALTSNISKVTIIEKTVSDHEHDIEILDNWRHSHDLIHKATEGKV